MTASPQPNPLPAEARFEAEMSALGALAEAKTWQVMRGQMPDAEWMAEQRMAAAQVHSNLAVSHGLDQLETTIKAIGRAFWPDRMRQQREQQGRGS